ncbi:hypothetical protein HHK36_015207 [Tetracentron sinense]|uniref:Uncharacterized protein n=1 Tax=Tetracentron sinense TaxID=13715 RepID=A0A834Z4P4_TETSI|nr:hypothetical protein HHK36_015207 [Tetracentron sinense]
MSMEGNNSWADQWDYSNPDPVPDQNKKGDGATAKVGKKVGEGFGKTKAVASTGIKKVKEGTTVDSEVVFLVELDISKSQTWGVKENGCESSLQVEIRKLEKTPLRVPFLWVF